MLNRSSFNISSMSKFILAYSTSNRQELKDQPVVVNFAQSPRAPERHLSRIFDVRYCSRTWKKATRSAAKATAKAARETELSEAGSLIAAGSLCVIIYTLLWVSIY